MISTRKNMAGLFLALALVLMPARFTSAFELVHEGKPNAVIVIPADALAVETYAAKELQYHVQASSGAELQIVSEKAPLPAGGHIFLGNCKAAAVAHLDPSSLPGSSYKLKTAGTDTFIRGADSPGDPLDRDTQEGTLFGVYDLLETHLGVRWLWPGKLGEVIPKHADISLPVVDATVKPLLWFKEWRNDAIPGERIWLKRQRFGRSVQPSYGHSFGNYWPRFGATHPEFFGMTPDGVRGFTGSAHPRPDHAHMCVSDPGLMKQIIDDWKAKGSPEFLNVCENDGWAGCVCERCMSWDVPDPDNAVPFDQRLAAAKNVFDGKNGPRDAWPLPLGSLSDRYARFWENVADEARKTRPDVKVVSYVYDNYRKAPIKTVLSPNVLCGIVPGQTAFGYGKADSDAFRRDWIGWEKSGCVLFLRPNYTLQADNFPVFWARTLGEDLKFAMAHSLRGTDFDSLTSKYATQGPTLYMLAAILNHPDASVDMVLEDYYSAFGPARDSVKEYFAHCESIYPQFAKAEQDKRLKAKEKYGADDEGPYYLLAGEIFTPDVMQSARKILEKARAQSAGNVLAADRVEWLVKGLDHAELILAVEKAYENAIDTGNKSDFNKAFQALTDFRSQNAAYDKSNFAGLAGDEKIWTRVRK